MILIEKQVHIPNTIGMRRIKRNIKQPEYSKHGKNSKTLTFHKNKSSYNPIYRSSQNGTKKSEVSEIYRRKSLDTHEVRLKDKKQITMFQNK